MKTLLDLVNDRHAINQLLDESGGEVTNVEIEDIVTIWMNENALDLESKIDNYRNMQLTLESKIAQHELFIKQHQAKKGIYNRSLEFLKTRLKQSMIELQVTELNGIEHQYKLAKGSPSVEILDIKQIPATFCREKITIEPDKIAIKMALLNHSDEIPGAVLNTTYKLIPGVRS
jgi:hypothetical protein